MWKPNNPFHADLVVRVATGLLLLLGPLLGCSDAPQPADVANPIVETTAEMIPDEGHLLPIKLHGKYLPNPVQVHQRVISGGLPEGDAAFKELAELGVKTIISVDGMKPDVAAAGKYGMRYVHLPHGYDGIPASRVKELAKAVRDLDGPVYIHCHHGKHRSPAAASVACVSAGLIPSNQAIPILKLAGTDPNYIGLYAAAEEAVKFEPAVLDELPVDFSPVQQIPPMAEAMVHLSHASEHLQVIAASGWTRPPGHPDLEPAHEVLLLRELFVELLRTEEVASQPDDFREWLRNSATAAEELHSALEEWQSSREGADPPTRLSELAMEISADCKACHLKYRDVPRRAE